MFRSRDRQFTSHACAFGRRWMYVSHKRKNKMKTKNIIKKGLLLISVATFASCSSFLEEENWTSQSAEDYYKTAKGYESLVNGAYASLKSVYNNYSYHKLTQLGTDIGTQPNGTVTSDLNQYVVTYDKSNGTVYEQWSKLYVALKDVNAAIGLSLIHI